MGGTKRLGFVITNEFHGGNGMKNNNKGFSLLELLIVVAIILIIATIAIPSLLRSRQAANESAAVANLRTINTAEVTYLSSNGGQYGDLDAMIAAGLLDETFTGTKAGYNYSVDATDPNNYTAEAVPASTNTGRYGYYAHPDAVVRYSTTATLAPSGQAGRSVQ
jgi:type IV pilus assembly protein PilA